MGFAKAKFKLLGEKDSLEGTAIVDTGSLMSIVDKEAADGLGLERTGRFLRLTTLFGEEASCDEMLSKVFEVKGEKLVSERLAVCRLPRDVEERLRAMEASPHVIIGAVTLEAAGFTVNPLTGKLEKVGWLALCG